MTGAALAISVSAAPPEVSGVTALQRSGTKLVDVSYTLADADSAQVTVSLEISSDGGATWFVPGTDLSGAAGSVASGNHTLTWNAAVTRDVGYLPAMRFRIVADDRTAPDGFTLIPQGTFEMGEFQPIGPYTGDSSERPAHSASISPFYIAVHELSYIATARGTWRSALTTRWRRPGESKGDAPHGWLLATPGCGGMIGALFLHVCAFPRPASISGREGRHSLLAL